MSGKNTRELVELTHYQLMSAQKKKENSNGNRRAKGVISLKIGFRGDRRLKWGGEGKKKVD